MTLRQEGQDCIASEASLRFEVEATRRPNFFLVGAPKCGTTAMATYLGDHPEVYMSPTKEPHYFNTDLDDPIVRGAWTPDEYLQLFEGARHERVVGEASVLYLFSNVALQNIRAFDPAARILIMLRSPIELVHAFHSQLLFSGQETIPEVGRAWRQQDGREGSALLHYGSVARLGHQLDRALRIFPDEQVLTVLFDDFARDTQREYQRVLDFLGLSDDGRTEFPVINSSYRHRSKLLDKLLVALPEPKSIKRLMGIERLGLLQRLADLNVTEAPRPAMPPALIDELREYFSEDVALLSSLLGRDLAHWLDEPNVS